MSSLTPFAHALVVVLLLALGMSLAPTAPVLAADCTARRAGADLRYCNLSGFDLSGVTLTGADLRVRGANLRNTNLNGARLAGANLAYADLLGATFSGANLRGANLAGAKVYPDTLDGANVRGATLGVIVVARPVVVLNPVVLTGFQPNTAYPGRYSVDSEYLPVLDDTVTTDGGGNAFFEAIGGLGVGRTVEVSIGGVSSGTSTVACSAP